MRRNVCIVAMLGLLALTLAGCADAQASGQAATEADTKQQTSEKTAAEDAKSAKFNCPVSPITTERPENDNTAAWSGTWYRSPNGEIWASEPGLRKLREGGDKVLWVKPFGSKLTITGKRLDGDAPPLKATAPDGYEMFDYQASGITFPTAGCWEIAATAGKTNWRFVVNIIEGD
jgi:hypothetical protein